ncbi:hypothetical protein J6590_019053 [Homalodisca vitripennis]|nr:hypothetical protein J6590_019053 [Homalodisca vitripennis]
MLKYSNEARKVSNGQERQSSLVAVRGEEAWPALGLVGSLLPPVGRWCVGGERARRTLSFCASVADCAWTCESARECHVLAMSCPEVVYQAYYPYLYQRASTSAGPPRTSSFPPYYDRVSL